MRATLVRDRQGQYHGENNFAEYVKKNVDLIEDIKHFGIKDPITVKHHKNGIEVIDGFHRLVIASIFNNELKPDIGSF